MAPGASHGLAAREVGADAAIAAGLVHQGSLASDGPLRLFALCASTGATGRLTLSGEGERYWLTFRKGSLDHAASAAPEDSLPAALVARHVLTVDQLRQAEAGAAAVGGDVVAALVTLRLVNPGDIVGHIQEHGAGLTARALALEAGEWRWEPGVAAPPGAFSLGSPWTLLGAAVRALDAGGVLRRLGEREQLGISRMTGRVRLEELRLTPREARAATLFDGHRLADVARAHQAEASTILRVALLLTETDLVSFGPPRAGAPARNTSDGPERSAAGAESRGAPASAATPIPARAATPAPLTPPLTPPAATAPSPGDAPRPPAPSPAAPRPAPTVAPPPRPAPAAARPATTPAPGGAMASVALTLPALQALLARFHDKDADHFTVLGVKRDAAPAQIKIAYFQLAKTYHPDSVPGSTPDAVKKLCADAFSRISEAWGVLGDDARRVKYLDDLKTGAGVDVDVMNILAAESTFDAGTLLVKARQYEAAIVKFVEAMQLNPDEAEFAMWKAWCEFLLAQDKRNVHAAAAQAIEAGLKKNPRCAQGYLFLGQMAKLVGDVALAERQLKRGLQVSPDHADMQRELKYLRK